MLRHVKNYMNYFSLGEQDFISCEMCASEGVDIHHIKYRSQGGTDDIENLICLCRNCHNLAHENKISKEELQRVHDEKTHN